MPKIKLMVGDCVERMKAIPSGSVDAVVTDPPYGLSKEPDVAEVMRHWLAGDDYKHKGGGFMGKAWDSFVPGPSVWMECYRALKPGGHLLAFAGTRTQDLMGMAIRLAGFECRDCAMWVYGSGFPKSASVPKMIDKELGKAGVYAGAKSEAHAARKSLNVPDGWSRPWMADPDAMEKSNSAYHPAAEEAKQWDGWGSALKPAYEPCLMFRKPLEGTIASNVLKHGVGGINVDGCRVGTEARTWKGMSANQPAVGTFRDDAWVPKDIENTALGRFPANLIHDGSDEVVRLFPETKSVQASKVNRSNGVLKHGGENNRPSHDTSIRTTEMEGFNDSGSAARFFYCAKASKRERGGETNSHPTVKPVRLMEYLCKLVTPEGALILDPFLGSGSTGVACVNLGRAFIGIEMDKSYHAIASKRIKDAIESLSEK